MKLLRSRRDLLLDTWLRLLLFVLFIVSEHCHPFERVVHLDKSDLTVPHVPISYFPALYLWITVITVPILLLSLCSISGRDRLSLLLATTLLAPLNGLITNIIKLGVGRIRPDFAARCWGQRVLELDEHVFDLLEGQEQRLGCTGDSDVVAEGRKSFPSGHSSFAFSTFVFAFLVLSAKLRIFARPQTNSCSLVLAITTLMPAVLIAISRTCDYHHHWQDVLFGSFLGSFLAILVYFHYYPGLSHPECHKPSISLAKNENSNNSSSINSLDSFSKLV